MRKYLLSLIVIFAVATAAALSQPFVKLYGGDQTSNIPASSSNPVPVSVQGGGLPLASTTSLTAVVPNVSTTVTLVAASTSVTVLVQPGAAAVSVNFNGGAATTANFTIPPGYSFTFSGSPVTTFKIIGASALGSYSVFAH